MPKCSITLAVTVAVLAALLAFNESKAPAALDPKSWLITSVLPVLALVSPMLARHTINQSDFAAVATARRVFDIKSLVPLVLFRFNQAYQSMPSQDTTLNGVPVTLYNVDGFKHETKQTIVFIHGGGFAFGSRATHAYICRRLASELGNGTTVVNIEYRLSPEHKHPAGLEDVATVVRFVVSPAATKLKLAPSNVVLAGDSAGGNLATAVLLHLMQHKEMDVYSRVRGQLLIYPAVHMSCPHCYVSSTLYGQGYFLTAADKSWFAGAYVHNESHAQDPTVSPMLASNDHLAQMPSTMVVVAEADILHDEGLAYAARLQEQGATVVVKEYKRTIHGFFTHALSQHEKAVADAVAWLREV
eukprot:m.25583 g.25583  ORF g.25583 m.25583 type:complete len:358 (-) comp11613_c0_seq1:37-1110(-)